MDDVTVRSSYLMSLAAKMTRARRPADHVDLPRRDARPDERAGKDPAEMRGRRTAETTIDARTIDARTIAETITEETIIEETIIEETIGETTIGETTIGEMRIV